MGWTPKSFQPAAAGWAPKSFTAAPAAPNPDASDDILARMVKTAAGRRGLAQGATAGHEDEAVGAVQALTDDPRDMLSLPVKALASWSVDRPQSDLTTDIKLADERDRRAPKSTGDQLRSMVNVYRQARDSERGENDRAKAADPNAYLAGNIVGGLPAAIAAPSGQGSKLLQLLKTAGGGAAIGGINAAGESRADLTKGEVGQYLGDTATGAGLGAGAGLAGAGLGAGLGKIAQMAGGRAAGIEAQVASRAAEEAAAGTASARSAAGRAAQDAYKQLEHLRELGAVRALNPEEAQVAATLEQELAQKAQEKLVPAAAAKEATAAEYQQAMASEAKRAKDAAAQKLSGSELMRLVGDRAKRYGPGLLGAVAGHFIPGLGHIGGAAAGLVLRPMVGSMRRLAGSPVVQHALASGIESLAGGVGPLLEETALPALRSFEGRAVPAAQRELKRELLQLIPQLAGGDDDLAKQKALAQALRGQ